MAALAKADVLRDIKMIFDHSGSEGGLQGNLANYVWDLFVTEAGGTPTTVHEATAITFTITAANAYMLEKWR